MNYFDVSRKITGLHFFYNQKALCLNQADIATDAHAARNHGESAVCARGSNGSGRR